MKRIWLIILSLNGLTAFSQQPNYFSVKPDVEKVIEEINKETPKYDGIDISGTRDKTNDSYSKAADKIDNKVKPIVYDKRVVLIDYTTKWRIPNTDLSFLVSGKEGNDLLKSDVSVKFDKPEAQIKMTFPIWQPEFANAASMNVFDNQTLASLAANAAWLMQVQFKGGVDNNIVSILDNTKLNGKASLQVGFSCVFPGAYKMKVSDAAALKKKLEATEADETAKNQLNLNLISAYAARIAQLKADIASPPPNPKVILLNNAMLIVQLKLDEEKLQETPNTNLIKLYEKQINTLNTDLQQLPPLADVTALQAELHELERKLDAETKATKDADTQKKDLQAALSKTFEKFNKAAKTFQWVNFFGELNYNEHLRYSAGSGDASVSALDTARKVLGGAGVSYNIFYSKDDKKAFNKFYFSLRLKLGHYNNTENADWYKVSSKDSIVDTVNKVTVVVPGITGTAYSRDNLEKKFTFNLSSDFIWFLDKDKIVGINLFASLNFREGSKVSLTPGVGLAFSVPKKGDDGKKAVVNFLPYLQFKDITRSQHDNGNTRAATDYVNLGIKAEVPFTLFNKF